VAEAHYLPRGGGFTIGFKPLPPAALLPLPPLVGVTDLEIGVVGFSPSSFLVDGVLAFELVPLRGLKRHATPVVALYCCQQ
jgi:hypothetical protein